MSLVDMLEIGGMIAGASAMIYGLNELKNKFVPNADANPDFYREEVLEKTYSEIEKSIDKRKLNY
jgi:hypothetical protein